MIDGLSLEYAHTRVSACLGRRPDDRLWQQLRSCRSVAALLEAVRASVAADAVSGIEVNASGELVELAFRQQLRSRIDEVASWSPPEWRAALLFTRHLTDLPALVHFATEEPAPAWALADPALAAAATGRSEHDTQCAEALAGVTAAIRQQPATGAQPHAALAAWKRAWQSLWPAVSAEIAEPIRRVARQIEEHVRRFGALSVEEAPAARQTLAATMASLVHRHPAQPAALFAYLAVFALDLERLRGEFVRRAYTVA